MSIWRSWRGKECCSQRNLHITYRETRRKLPRQRSLPRCRLRTSSVGVFPHQAGDEVDLVLERDDGQVIAFEIKAGTRIGGEDLRGLRLLKDRLGSRLEEAIVLSDPDAGAIQGRLLS